MVTAADRDAYVARLSQLRDDIIRDAVQAQQPVNAELIANRRHPDRLTELTILTAELHLRLGRIYQALNISRDAGVVAQELPDTDPLRTIAFGVSADIAVWDGHPDAVVASTLYARATVRWKSPEAARVVLSGALRAVALYQHADCQEGRRLIEEVILPTVADDLPEVRATLQACLEAMSEGCRPSAPRAPVAPVPAMPGGVLHPSVSSPPIDYLATRVRHHAAVHTCALRRR
jgi:hypothetical protein